MPAVVSPNRRWGGYDVWNTVKTWFLATIFLTDPSKLNQYSNYFDKEPTRTPERYYEEALYIIDAVKQRFGV